MLVFCAFFSVYNRKNRKTTKERVVFVISSGIFCIVRKKMAEILRTETEKVKPQILSTFIENKIGNQINY